MKKYMALLLILAMVMSVIPFTPVKEVSAAGSSANLALGAKVIRTARNGWEGGIFLPRNLVDGDYNSIWASYYSAYTDIPAGEKFRHLVEFDLGKEELIGSVVITSRPEMEERNASANLEIHLSNDKNFNNYVVVGKTDAKGLGHAESVTFTVPKGYSYRYFRVVKTVHSVIILAEIEVYGAAFDPTQLTDYEDVQDKKLTDAVNLAQTLKIIDDTSSDEFGVNKLITRGEAAQWLARAAKLSSSEESSSFGDIADSPYAEQIKSLESAGIASKADKYNPENFITYNEFLTMLIRTLGYEKYASVKGGYPVGAQWVARQIDLLDGMYSAAFTDYVNRANAIRLIYQMLITPIQETTGIKGDLLIYEKSDKLIEKLYSYDIIEGQVTANDTTGLYDVEDAANWQNIKIGKTSYRDVNNKLWKYIGKRVVALIDKNDTDYTVLNAWVDEETEQITKVYGTDIIDFSNDTITYRDVNNKKHTVTIESGYPVLKNYNAYPSFKETDFENDRISIELIDANKNNKPDTIFIYDAIPIVPFYKDVSEDSVHVGQSDDNSISSYYDTPTRVDVDEIEHLHLQQGESFLMPAGIIEPQLMMVYKSDDNKVVRIDVFKDVVSGYITGSDEDGVYIDDEYFEFSPFYPQVFIDRLKIGDAVSFVTDETGRIVRNSLDEAPETAETLGFIISGGMVYGTSFRKVTYKVFSENGKMIYLNLAKKVKFTDIYGSTSRKDAKEVSDILKTGEQLSGNTSTNVNGAFVRYKLNSDGEISVISCQSIAQKKANRYYSTYSRAWTSSRWGTQHVCMSKPETVVFNIPFDVSTGKTVSDDEYDSYYGVTNVQNCFLNDYTQYYTEMYLTTPETDTDKKSPYPDFIAHYCGHSFGAKPISPVKNTSATKILFESMRVAVNEDDTESYVIKGYNVSNGEQITVRVHPDIKKLIESNKLMWAKKRGESGISALYGEYSLIAESKVDSIPQEYISDISELVPGDIIACSSTNGFVTGIERILQRNELETCTEEMGESTFYYEVGENLGTMAANYKLISGQINSYNYAVLKMSNSKQSLMTEYPRTLAAFTVDADGTIKRESTSVIPGYWYIGDRTVFCSSGVGNQYGSFSIITYK